MKNIMQNNIGSNEQNNNIRAVSLQKPTTARSTCHPPQDHLNSLSETSSETLSPQALCPSLASLASVENPGPICVNPVGKPNLGSVIENVPMLPSPDSICVDSSSLVVSSPSIENLGKLNLASSVENPIHHSSFILHNLLNDLSSLIPRFVILPPHAAETLALWILHTYALDLRDTTAYLGIESPYKGCGKTTLLSVLHELAYNAVSASNISPAALFRVIEQVRPTLLIDEADTFLPGNDQLRGILNAGYKKKTAYVWRASADRDTHAGRAFALEPGTNQNSKIKNLNCFSTWCPKVIAQIGRLPETLADRCILIQMTKKPGSQRCERLKTLEFEAPAIREACARFISGHRTQIEQAEPIVPTELSDRAAEIWEPLLVLADIAGGDWPKLAREAAVALSSSADRVDPIALLIADIQSIFNRLQRDRLFTRTILDELKKMNARPWFELANGNLDDRWLAKQLGARDIKARSVRTDGTTGRGYVASDFGPGITTDVVHVADV